MKSTYVAARAALGLVASAAACAGGSPNPDAMVEEQPALPAADGCVLRCTDANTLDAPAAPDVASLPDAAGDGRGDSGPPGMDATVDAAPVGPCALVGGTVKVANDPARAPRGVFPLAASAGFVVGARAQPAGVDNVFLTAIGADGGAVNVSEQTFARVAGGAVAADGAGYVVAYSSATSGPDDIYLRRVSAGAVNGAALPLTHGPGTSDSPRVVATPTGWTVLWRSLDSASVPRLAAAAVAAGGFTVSPITIVTPAGIVPGAFDAASDGARTVAVYVDATAGAGDVYAVSLGLDAAPTGATMAVTTRAHIASGVGVALRGARAAVVWAAGTLRARTVDLDTGTLGAPSELAAAGAAISTPGIALDGAGYVTAFRGSDGTGGAVSMLRLDAALAARELPSRIAQVASGESVRVAAHGDGTYAVAWDDVTAAGTTANVQVLRCP